MRGRAAAQEEELREIEVLIYSAEDLKNVKHIRKMRAFAEVYVERGVHVARTRVDEQGGGRVLLCDALKGGDAAEPVDNPIQCLTVQVWRPHGWLNL
ncbi:hypothetical protein SASPL_121534 [Salvia splendens]|uniref:Uncharacterized protein n=1 Tax=Salvia splendens TaxID=180675 RepID=A0A8X8XV51_SALSN|nr:hypothetical protein SASPL_121534 [Salvia splendens]